MVHGGAMDSTDILNAIRDSVWNKFSDSMLKSTSLVQLLELGVIQGVVRSQHYTASRHIN